LHIIIPSPDWFYFLLVGTYRRRQPSSLSL
jgi:hypothetical protein